MERVASPDVSSLQFGAAFLSLTVLASAAILVFLVIQQQQAGASIANVGTAARLGPGCWRGGGGRLQACGLDKLEPQYFSHSLLLSLSVLCSVAPSIISPVTCAELKHASARSGKAKTCLGAFLPSGVLAAGKVSSRQCLSFPPVPITISYLG